MRYLMSGTGPVGTGWGREGYLTEPGGGLLRTHDTIYHVICSLVFKLSPLAAHAPVCCL